MSDINLGNCIIVGAGDFYGLVSPLTEGDLVIAADGGIEHLGRLGIKPHIWVGDNDSTGKDFFDSANEEKADEIITLPCEKDDTDVFFAVKLGMERGFKTFFIYGGMGGRFDHTMGNVKILEFLAENGCRGFLYDKASMVTVIRNSAISFPKEATGYVSVFSMADESRGVTIRGLKYELTDAVLTGSASIGVSNEFTGSDSYISVRDGKLLVVLA